MLRERSHNVVKCLRKDRTFQEGATPDLYIVGHEGTVGRVTESWVTFEGHIKFTLGSMSEKVWQ